MSKTSESSNRTLRDEKVVSKMRAERNKMAHRPRRIIFNNDGDDLAAPGADTVKGLLKARTTALLGSQVDSIFYYSTWGMKLHHRQGPFGKLYHCPCPDRFGINMENYRKLFARTGKDTLEIMIDTCRARGLEIFYSNRMNDFHDSFWPEFSYDSRTEHPEWCMAKESEGRKYEYPDIRTAWSAWNFEVPEIRQLTVEALREVCRTYDIDGLELDFSRGPVYFKPTMELKAVGKKHLDLMTDLVRKIRLMTEEEGLRRGRPILLSAVALTDPALSRSIGLDVETWLREGLIDVLTVGSWVEFTPIDQPFIELAHRYDVPAYALLSTFIKAGWCEGGTPGQYDISPAALMVWRGDAMNYFHQRADGVYAFNLFDPDAKQWRELGDPKKLAGMDKTYVWDYLPSQRKTSNLLSKMRMTRGRGPVTVTDQGCESMPLYIGEDLGKHQDLLLRLQVKNLPPKNTLNIKVNGHPLTSAQTRSEDGWIYLKPDPKVFKAGKNLVKTFLKGSKVKEPVEVDQLRLDVRVVKGTAK
jgi:hypothetical protein